MKLTERDVAGVVAVQRQLLSPLGEETFDGWRRRATEAMRDLVGADRAAFLLLGVGQGPAPLVAVDLDDRPARDYSEYYFAQDLVVPRAHDAGLLVYSRQMLWDEPSLHRSEFWNDFIAPNQLHEPVAMTIGSDAAPHHPSGDAACAERPVGFVTFVHERCTGYDRADRQMQLLALLQPAVVAGVRAHLQLAAYRSRLAALVDVLAEGVAFCAPDGAIVHENAALGRMLTADPEGEAVRRAIRRSAAAVAAVQTCRARRAAELGAVAREAPRSTHECRTTTARYRVTGTAAGDELGGPGASAVVVERLADRAPAPADLRARFGLTAREAEVALLLARGLSNDAVAATLGLSPHTARHHTERVLPKLGVRSRAGVAAVLRGD